MPAADGGWCGSGWRQQPATAAVEARIGAAEAEAAVAQGTGNGARRLSSIRARLRRALRRLWRGGDEVNEKPTPPHFISG